LTPRTASTNLAQLLRAQGDDYCGPSALRACPRHHRARAGPDHPDTGARLNNLAGLLSAQGDYTAARPLYERALAIIERTLGQTTLTPGQPQQPGRVAARPGRLYCGPSAHRARPRHHERALGPDHPDTANSLSKPGSAVQRPGKYAQAQPLLNARLRICERHARSQAPHDAHRAGQLAALGGGSEPPEKPVESLVRKTLGLDHQPSCSICLQQLDYNRRAQRPDRRKRPCEPAQLRRAPLHLASRCAVQHASTSALQPRDRWPGRPRRADGLVRRPGAWRAAGARCPPGLGRGHRSLRRFNLVDVAIVVPNHEAGRRTALMSTPST